VALEIMTALGFQHTYHLDGGIQAWQEQGFPVIYFKQGEKNDVN
jgi:rhodanese-related sulfurtransferase